jgi:hypothetical protein
MGYKYYIKAYLNGACQLPQEYKNCKSFIVMLINLVIFRLKYPIVDIEIRNGYKNCAKCKNGSPFCRHEEADNA